MRATASWRDEPRPPGQAVLVDIDGVLADASWRQHYLNNPEGRRDWKGFFGSVGDDPLLPDVPRLLELMASEVVIVLLSARPAWVLERTVGWLARVGVRWDLLVLRADGDHTPAAEFKREVASSLRESDFEISCAFDDDQRTVDMYKALGIPALYIHSGYYAAASGPI